MVAMSRARLEAEKRRVGKRLLQGPKNKLELKKKRNTHIIEKNCLCGRVSLFRGFDWVTLLSHVKRKGDRTREE